MLLIGLTITKSTAFRGVQQEFHNTYHFKLATAVTAPSESIVDEVVTKERPLHSPQVSFVRAQVWTAGGTKAENQMIFQKPLSGTGSGTSGASVDKERALLVQWKAGFDSRGIQVYLRKWYHCSGNPAAGAVDTPTILQNTSELTTAVRNAVATQANGLRSVGSTEFWGLVSSKGRETTDPAVCHRYLEHHQLGDAWR